MGTLLSGRRVQRPDIKVLEDVRIAPIPSLIPGPQLRQKARYEENPSLRKEAILIYRVGKELREERDYLSDAQR